jgi:nicotinate phosphoribosyltransferase
LLETVMASGVAVKPLPALTAIRDRCAAQLRALPESVRRLRDPAAYPVAYSDRLLDLQRSLKAEIGALEVGTP